MSPPIRTLTFEQVQVLYNHSYSMGFADGLGFAAVVILVAIGVFYFWKSAGLAG